MKNGVITAAVILALPNVISNEIARLVPFANLGLSWADTITPKSGCKGTSVNRCDGVGEFVS